jgi:hypothetical protein
MMTNTREYLGPVRPTRGARWDAWCGNGEDAGRSAEWRDGFNYAMQTMALWLDFQTSRVAPGESRHLGHAFQLSSIGMLKSNLLGRLMHGDEIRRISCPTHLGALQFRSSSFGTDVSCCDGTGWLRNDREESEEGRRDRRRTHGLTHPQHEGWWRNQTAPGSG